MGCSGSKLEELEAVALCRGRTDLLADAIRHRYALADAHAAYVLSLQSVGVSLHRFLDSNQEIISSSSPVLPLPAQRKGDPLPPSSPPPPRHSHSHSGGSGPHIQFHSSDGDGDGDDDDEGSGSDFPLHSENSSPSHHHLHFHHQQQEQFYETLGGPPFVNYNYARSQPQPQPPSIHFAPVPGGGSEQQPAETLAGPTSISYHYARSQPQPSSVHFARVPDGGDHHLDEQQPAETLPSPTVNYHYARNQPQPPSVHFATPGGGGGGGDPSSSSAPPPYSDYSNYPSYPSAYPTNNYYGYGFFGPSSSSPPPNLAPPAGPFGAAAAESSAKPPPPPPSPPRVSTWDFLNPFEVQDNYYPSYPPSRSSREVRDEEGIPDLEEEVDEIVKEVYGEQKFVGSTSKEYRPSGNEEGIESVGENSRSNEVENEEDVVEKKVVADEVRRPELQQNGAAGAAASSKLPRRYQNVPEIGSEIRVQFERAADAALELSKMLEVGKHPYRHKRSSVVGAASRMMCAMPPFSSDGEDFLSLEEDIAASSKNLSSTLQKLYIWEKKLQDEVRDEEKLRLLHEKNCKRLRYLAERGADAQKLEDAQKFIKKLSTKIRIAIQVVDSISNKINALRDDELWPRISELIQGLMRMWKVLLECHHIQRQAILEAKGLDSIASSGKLNDTQLSAMVDLELELLRWTSNFASWIKAQKDYVKALNGWLVLCLHYEPEVTADGVPPYSPGRIGAPPVFVICNSWSQALDMLSEMEVINAMQAFATNLRHLWEQHSVDPHQKTMPNRDMDRLVRDREREAQIVLREVDALNKKLVLVSGQNELPDYSAGTSSLHLGLRQIFEAMENFTANSFKAYEELHMRSEEERVASEHAKTSG